MAKYKGEISQASIKRKLKEGRGQGEQYNYLPWLTIHDVPSKGRSHVVQGWKSRGRDHHLLSDGELYCFYAFEWFRCIKDIREQFPLSQEATLAIAEGMGISHPAHPISKHPIVMTTDFLLTLEQGGQTIYHALTFKYVSDLNVKRTRTVEKFEIERIYWKTKDIYWAIVTEQQLPMTLVRNVSIIHESLLLDGYGLTQDEISDISTWLTLRVKQQDKALRHLTSECDRSLGFEPGTSLRIAYHLIANRHWLIDMNVPIEPGNILVVENL
jgi:hypothetical protein